MSSAGADDSFVMTEEQVKLIKNAVDKDRVNPLLISLIWMIVGGFMYFYFDLQSVLLFDSRISRYKCTKKPSFVVLFLLVSGHQQASHKHNHRVCVCFHLWDVGSVLCGFCGPFQTTSFWVRLSAALFGSSFAIGTVCVLSTLLFQIDYEQRWPWAVPVSAVTGVASVVS